MSALGSLYIKLGEPDGELCGCTCEVGDWAAGYIADLTQQRDKLLAALEGLTDDICSLIDESSGVANLHLNGDIAFWSELEAGGQFERLTHLPDALRIIAEVKGQP